MLGTQNYSGIVGIKHHLCQSVAFEIEFPHWMQLLIILKAMTRLGRILNKTQTRFDLKIALTAVETYNGEDCRSTRVAVEHCQVLRGDDDDDSSDSSYECSGHGDGGQWVV